MIFKQCYSYNIRLLFTQYI